MQLKPSSLFTPYVRALFIGALSTLFGVIAAPHAQATGATVLGIKAKLLKKIRFYVPNELAVQEKIASACEEAFERRNRLISLYNGKLVDLATLRQTLLQKAFAGELT